MVPVFYLIGSALVRATAKKVIQELAKRGAKKIPASQASKMKETPINVTMKNLDRVIKNLSRAPKGGPKRFKGTLNKGKPPATQGSRAAAKKPSTAVTKPSSTSVATKASRGDKGARPMKDITPKPKQVTGPKNKKSRAGLLIAITSGAAGIGTFLGGGDKETKKRVVVPTKTTVDITDSIPQERKKPKTKSTGSFGDAFKKAYDKGKGRGKTFTYDGNKYIAITKDDLKNMGGSGYTLKDYIRDSKRTPGKKYKK